jgi:hypothetical protein
MQRCHIGLGVRRPMPHNVPIGTRMLDAIYKPRCHAPGLQVDAVGSAAALARAKGYPYSRPDTSFLFVNGTHAAGAFTFPDASWIPTENWGDSLEPLLRMQVAGTNGVCQRCCIATHVWCCTVI